MANLIYGEGPKTARIAIVAEAPATEELRLSRPLVGATGKLNDRMLSSAGLHRSDLFLTNIWKEQINSKPKNFPYNLTTTEKWKRYKELLYLELIDLPNLTVIGALGEMALYALTAERGVTKKRGSVYLSTLLPGVKVLAIRHPSAALPFRNFCLQYVMVHDYTRLKEESEFPDIRPPERDLLINPTFDQVLDYLRSIRSGDTAGCDIESPRSVGELTHISFSKSPTNGICIPFKIGDRNTFDVDQETEIWIEITRIAEDPTITVVGHNFSFDATYQFRKYGIRYNAMRDSMQAQGIVYAGLPKVMKPKGLAFVASIHTRERYYKDDGKQFNISGIGSEDNYQLYNARDACVSMESEQKLIGELKQQGNYEEYLRTCRLIEPLVYMGERGIKVNVERLNAASTDAANRIEQLREQMFSEVGREFNPGSIPQLKKIFYVERGHQPYTFKGKIKCDVKAMKRLSIKGDPLAKMILDYRFYSKRKSTYYDVKLSDDGRFKCAYNPYLETETEVKKSGGTRQARLSSGKNIFDEGTNAQNLPDEMLRCLIADDGYVTYNIDLEQAENRIVAYIAPDQTMIEAFENKTDIHSLTAKHVFGYPSIEAVTRKPPCTICINAGQPELCGHKGDRFWGKKDNHCELDTTQVLTPTGWKEMRSFDEENDSLAQWDPLDGSITFVKATAFFRDSYSGTMYEIENGLSHQIVTPNHRIPYIRRDTNELIVKTAENFTTTLNRYFMPLGGMYKNNKAQILKEAEIRLLVATQADGNIDSIGGIVFRFSKQRKIDRLLDIINALGLERNIRDDGSIYLYSRNDIVRLIVRLLGSGKKFGDYLLSCPGYVLKAFIKELPHWDGYLPKNKYFTTVEQNAVIVQTIAHLAGFRASINKRENTHGFGSNPIYTVRICEMPRTTFRNMKRTKIEVKDVGIACPTVPSGFFLIRSNNKISVTGNSLNYGEGPNLFAVINEIEVAEAKRQIRGYFDLYPGIATYHEWIKNQLYKTRTLTNPFGRTFYFMDLIDKSLKQAYSYIPQTTVAGIINWRGILNIWDTMPEVELQAQVHDSIRFQIPVNIGWQRHAKILNQIRSWLEEPIEWRGRSFSIPINCEVGLNFLDMIEVDLKQTESGVVRQLEDAYKQLKLL